MSTKQPPGRADDLFPLAEPFVFPFRELPFLQVFGLAFDSFGDVKTQVCYRLPADFTQDRIPQHQKGNTGLAKIKITDGTIEIVSTKIWRLSWSFHETQFGKPFADFLASPPAGTTVRVDFTCKKKQQSYLGTVGAKDCRLEAMYPAVAEEILQSAWSVAARRTDKSIDCANEAEAQAILTAASKDRFLRDMEVKHDGLKIWCDHDQGQLAALLFQYRFACHWDLPLLTAKRRSKPDAMSEAITTWRAKATPTDQAMATFETLRKMLLERSAGSNLREKLQEFPPKFELLLPQTEPGLLRTQLRTPGLLRSQLQMPGKTECPFASLGIFGETVYFDLYPLGWDVALRDRVSPRLHAMKYRPDDGFQFTGEIVVFEEIRELIDLAYQWFDREVSTGHRSPPSQSIDHYLIEPVDWHEDPKQEKEPGFAEYARQAEYLPLDDGARHLTQRLDNAFGKGHWYQAVLVARVLLPGWPSPCSAELHWYDRRPKEGREAWKIKRFIQADPVVKPMETRLVYAASADFPASLEKGKTYQCSAIIGSLFQAYVRICDESGEDYWYPERFFVPAK